VASGLGCSHNLRGITDGEAIDGGADLEDSRYNKNLQDALEWIRAISQDSDRVSNRWKVFESLAQESRGWTGSGLRVVSIN
jgi:hypothetical protein